MYILNSFIKKVQGENGAILINTANSEVLDLNVEDSRELSRILEGNENNDQFREYLLNNHWITYMDKKVNVEEIKIFDFSQSRMSLNDFKLSKVLIELSTKCTLDCIFCEKETNSSYTSCTCKRWPYLKKSVDYDLLVRQITKYNLEKVIIIGGDPFYDSFEELKCLLENLKKNHFSGEIVIHTNGSCLNRDKADFLRNYETVRVNIILLGSQESDYVAIARVPNIFKKIVSNIKMLTKRGINVNGTLIVNDYNISGLNLSKLEGLGIHIGVKYVYNENFTNYNILNNYKNRLIQGDYASYEALDKVNSCMFSQIFIAADMKVYPCPSLRDFEIGDLIREDLYEIFRRNDYKKFWFLSKAKIEKCNKCKYRCQCIDCRAVEYTRTKDLFCEYYCDIVKNIDICETNSQ